MTHTTRRSLFKAFLPAATGQRNRPLGRHLAFGADPTKQIVISWQQLEKVNGPYVRIATENGSFGAPISAELRTLKSEIKWQDGDHSFPPHGPDPLYQYYFHVELDNLKPDTTYLYVVGHQDYAPKPDEASSFRTAPTTNSPFTFTAFGDQGYGYNARKLNSLAKDQNPAFHLALGNLSYAIHSGKAGFEGGHPDTDKYDAARWNSLFAQNELLAATTPWMITLGNREMEEWHSPNGYGGATQRFTMPDNAWNGSTGIYAWRFQNVGLISLDSNDVCSRNTANLDYTKGKQLTWLTKQLADHRSDPKVDFIVVYLHHATYSTADGGAESIAQQRWAPIFDRYQVDLVLNAHNRVYERTDPIKAGKGSKTGTTYITAGGGGQALDKFYKDAPESYLGHENNTGTPTMRCYKKNSDKSVDTKVTWSRVRYRGYGITAIDVAGKTMKIRALDEDGTLIDEITLHR